MTESTYPTFELLIGGSSRPGRDGRTFPTFDPSTGASWANIAHASASDVDEAVSSARKAFTGEWRTMTATRRGHLMFRLADLIDSTIDELADLETRDCGKLFKEAHAQIAGLSRWYRFFGGYADKIDGRVPPLDFPSVLGYITREPLGVIAAISAWNSPLMLSSWKLAPALAAGNTIVLKPSELASASALRFGQLFKDAGFPPGVVNVIAGDAETGSHLVSHRDVDLVSFTGGPAAARAIGRAASENLTPTRFELGGKSANVLLADCDVSLAVDGVIAGVFAAAGQTCVAGSRVIVAREIADEVIEALRRRTERIVVGDPRAGETQVGPIVNAAHGERIKGLVNRAVAAGATIAAGGHQFRNEAGACFFEPTILLNVHNDMEIAQTEVFGPVLSVVVVDSEDEAIFAANGTPYSLAAGVWTRDVKRALHMSRALNAGTVWVNMYRSMSPMVPHGGAGESGYGRENGIEAIAEYTQAKTVLFEMSDDARDPFVGRMN